LFVLSGPSGAGKDAVLSRMKERGFPLKFVTTVTTRHRRASERDGIDYHFVHIAKFRELVKGDELLEHANVYGNWYGVPKKAIREALEEGWDTIIKVDIQGAATIKKAVPDAVFIFLTPPTIEELRERLDQRKTESAGDLAIRNKIAEEEIKQMALFDYIVFNRQGELNQAVDEICAIITAEKCRVNPREISL
jgi:guanylate kinase